MPYRLQKLLFLGLLLFLNPIVAFPALIGRDELGRDSLWGLELEGVFGAVGGALPTLWDFLTAPETTTIPSGVPSEHPDETQDQSSEIPGSVEFPFSESTAIKTCAAAGESQEGQLDRLAVENSWWRVEQEPETGYVAPKRRDCGYDFLLQSRGMAKKNEEKEDTDLGFCAGDL